MKPIVQIKYGSHLYGTSTPNSDLDIKGIYLPKSRDILLQSVQPIISFKRPKAFGEKNTKDDVDYELYSPARFLSQLAGGHPMALDMLFAPESSFLSPPLAQWFEIKNLAPKLFSKQADSFINYCKRQANKYGIKGSRISAAKIALGLLIAAENKYGSTTKLATITEDLKLQIVNNEFLKINEDGYFEICGKKLIPNSSIKSARLIAEKIVNNYGERALAAESNEGIDWKALSHAVRVGYEAIEFLQTQYITFPRPEAQHLLDIKLGKRSFWQVSEEIEQLLIEIEEAALNSTLPANYDQQIIDDFLEQLHLKQILKL